MEIEEIVLSNSTLSEDDFFRARRMGFMVEALWNTGYLRPALVFLANHGFKVTSVLQSILDEGGSSSAATFFNEYDELARGELASDPGEFDRRSAKPDYWNDLVNGRGVNVKINLAFAGRLLLFDNPFDEFFYDLLYHRYANRLSTADRAAFEQVLAHCRASKVDLEKPAARHLQLWFDVPEWIKATYPLDIKPFRLEHPVEYTYALDPDVLATALRTKGLLESYGARILNIAEHIFNEIPSFHRGTRAAVRKELPVGILAGSDALEQRVSWSG
jgi:hypothetical protein